MQDFNNKPKIRPFWHRYITTLFAAAMFWYGYGFKVIPIRPRTKIPAVKWDPWFDGFDNTKIQEYWSEHPDHELGCIVGDDMIVFDADSPESVAALVEIERRCGVKPSLVVKTRKGEHHYFRRASGTVAKSDSHDTKKYPNRIDIKTGRALVILPPSTGKTLYVLNVKEDEEFSEATQEFIDAVYMHNGRTAPSQSREPRPVVQEKTDGTMLLRLGKLLDEIDPDCGYDGWLRVGMAIYHETKGSEAGKDLFNTWSSLGTKYKSSIDIDDKWRTFRLDVPNPVTIGTLVKMVRDARAAYLGDDDYEFREDEVMEPADESEIETAGDNNPMAKYYLHDIDELERQAVEQKPILGSIALLGQATVLYAKQNTGKTLITLYLIIEGIRAGKFDPAKLIYINMDDNSEGLATKARLAEEYGFKMVADGHEGFESKKFRIAMDEMIENNTAKGVIVILDTLKKFVDTMDKRKSTDFAKVVRRFVLKGGTVIALSHANKHAGSDGKTIYSGTTDIIDDFDCGYTVTTISQDPDSDLKIVEFENIKRRGNVAISASYSYALRSDISYQELLLSVQEVDDLQVAQRKQKEETLSDAEIITAIESCIQDGIKSKMKLAGTAAERANVSKRSALKIIEKYTGDDPAIHKWTFGVRERGAKVYELLMRPAEPIEQDIVNL